MLSIKSVPESKFTAQVTTELKKLAARVRVEKASAASSRVSAGATILPNYQKGTRLIQALAASEYEIEISEIGAEQMDIDPKTGQKPPPYSMCSEIKGNRIEVSYSPEKIWEAKVWQNESKKTTAWEPFPKHIELGHELVHALRYALHTADAGYDTVNEYTDVTGNDRSEKVGVRESAVVGLGSKNKEGRGARFVTENLLRQETAKRPGSGGRPRQRVGYEARDPVSKIVH